MPKYLYTAKTHPAKTVQGLIDAESEQDAVRKLSLQKIFPLSIREEGRLVKEKGSFIFRKVPHKEIAFFTLQLASLLESGVNILPALHILLNQTSNKFFKAVLTDIISKIKDGKSLSESFNAYPECFPGLYTAMIHSGEAGGGLELTLKRLSTFLEKEEEFKHSLQSALMYPFILMGVSIITVVVLLTFVIPRLVSMFEDMGQILPLPTKILIAVSGSLRSNWLFIASAIIAAIFIIKRLYSYEKGRLFIDKTTLKFPVFGQITFKSELSRIMRTLSLLLSGGLPILNALDISISVLKNQALKAQMSSFTDKLAGGINFSTCLKDSAFFPEYVVSIVKTGEETGNLEKSLLHIADSYEKEVDRALKTLTRLLEPLIILVMGLVVGFIVLAMLLPIFEINLVVR